MSCRNCGLIHGTKCKYWNCFSGDAMCTEIQKYTEEKYMEEKEMEDFEIDVEECEEEAVSG